MTTRGSDKAHLLKQIEDSGYYLLPRSHPHSLGHTGLLVAVRAIPTNVHFDPVTIFTRVLDDDGVLEWTTFGLEWHYPKSCRVCAGRLILRDRAKNVVEFFTFGGTLESFSATGETVYSLRSPAPIIELVDRMETPRDAFVFETEVQIAKLHARWGVDDVGLYRRLGQADPQELYLASVDAVLSQLKNAPHMGEHRAELDRTLLEEKRWLEETSQWPVKLRTLEQLLAPSPHKQVAAA